MLTKGKKIQMIQFVDGRQEYGSTGNLEVIDDQWVGEYAYTNSQSSPIEYARYQVRHIQSIIWE